PLISGARGPSATALGKPSPAALGDSAYGAARNVAVAWRTVNMLQWFMPHTIERDAPWAPGVTVRQALLWHLERFLAFSIGGALAPVTDGVDGLRRALGGRWG